MSRLDLVIFGATGFTGTRVVLQLVTVAKKYPGLAWGVAGRSKTKLEALMNDIGEKAGDDLTNIRIIIAEVTDEKSLKNMCEQTKVLVNCCGPYLMYGEPVVKAAVEAKTHCIDVSGEPEYIDNVQLKYDQAAREAGVYVVSACGFDSIPNDMGLIYMQQNFDGTLNAVELYLSVEVTPEFQSEANKSGIIHFATWESTIISAGRSKELAPLRKQLYPEDMPTFEPKLCPRSTFHKLDDQWCVPFPGVDAYVAYRTQRFFFEHDQQRPAQFMTYMKRGKLCTAIQTGIAGFLIDLLSLTAPTMKLLLKYPKLFSGGMVTHEGPTENVMNNTNFTFELYGEGWDRNANLSEKPNKKAVVKVKGVNPAYGATVTAVIYCALACLTESDKMPGVIIIAEVTDEKSLKNMCEQTKVLVNCCGPYLMYGEPVVKAAVEAKTHCIDVSGEPEYIDNVQLKYDQAAREAGVYVVSACGFDSIPNDMGLIYMQQNFDGTLNAVELYLSVEVTPEFQSEANKSGIIHFATWESTIISAGRSKELAPLRKQLYPEDMPTFEPKLCPRSTFHKLDDQWCVPFPGVDAYVAYRTQRFFFEHDQQRPAQFMTYMKRGKLCTAIQTGIAGFLIDLLSLTAPTMKLLLKYPKLFSGGMVTHEGPTENVMNNTNFTFELYGEGWDRNANLSEKPNKKAVVKVKGVNPAYGATVTAVIYCALACLTESDKMPGVGGVLTTGVAFSKTSLIKNLNENNLTFKYIQN